MSCNLWDLKGLRCNYIPFKFIPKLTSRRVQTGEIPAPLYYPDNYLLLL